MRKMLFLVVTVLGVTALAAPALADTGAPSFAPAIYADGEVWATKGTAELPPPNAHNEQSFDALYIFTNGAADQLPVSEAAPGNPDFNGGRWASKTVTWTAAGIDAHGGSVPVLMDGDAVLEHRDLGHLDISPGHPAGGLDYFQCPLLPVN